MAKSTALERVRSKIEKVRQLKKQQAEQRAAKRSQSQTWYSSESLQNQPLPTRELIFRAVVNMDDVLVPLGHRRLSRAWRSTLHRWLVQSQALTLTVRKGRRIGASTIIAPRLIAAWMLVVVPRLDLPPGERITIGLVSVRRGEAQNRISQISAVLTALNIDHEPKSSSIEVTGAPVTIRVLTRDWRAVVGENIGILWCDEVARWDSDDASANPAQEVIGSLKPALATLQVLGLALMALISSPWSHDDYHAKQFDQGDTADQVTAFLPTWVGRDDITEEQTHALERDERIWSREYAGIPSNTLSGALDGQEVEFAFGMQVQPGAPAGGVERRICTIDASSLRGDVFAWSFWREVRGGLVLEQMGGWDDAEQGQVTHETIAEEISKMCHARGIRTVWGDQYGAAGLEPLFRRYKINLESLDYTNQSKHQAFLMLRRLLNASRIQLCPHAELKRQMRECKMRMHPSGLISYETNGLDYLSCLVTLIMGYQKTYSTSLSRILAGYLGEPAPSAEELAAKQAEERRLKHRRDAERRASRRAGFR